MSAVVHRPGEGEIHTMGPNTIAIKATSKDTDGGFFLSETTVGPGFPGPPPHTHQTLTDMFYVLEGTLTIRSSDDEIEAPPGTFACFPPGTVHTFRNDSDAPVRFLNFNIPGGWEHYMRDLAKAAQSGVPQTPEEIAKIAARYDIQPV